MACIAGFSVALHNTVELEGLTGGELDGLVAESSSEMAFMLKSTVWDVATPAVVDGNGS